MKSISLLAVPGIPFVRPGDDVGQIIVDCLRDADMGVYENDIVVIAQKIVSKAEGRIVHLADVVPTPEALHWAEVTNKDPRLVQVVLSDANEVVRARDGLIIVEQRQGFICANAGVDHSNIQQEGGDTVALPPAAPDASCRAIRQRIKELTGVTVAVIINDSHGRAFRNGAVGVAVGVAGLPALADKRGTHDLFGYEMQTTIVGFADEVASGASMLMGQTDEAIPVVLVRGLSYTPCESSAREICRVREKDLFR